MDKDAAFVQAVHRQLRDATSLEALAHAVAHVSVKTQHVPSAWAWKQLALLRPWTWQSQPAVFDGRRLLQDNPTLHGMWTQHVSAAATQRG